MNAVTLKMYQFTLYQNLNSDVSAACENSKKFSVDECIIVGWVELKSLQ